MDGKVTKVESPEAPPLRNSLQRNCWWDPYDMMMMMMMIITMMFLMCKGNGLLHDYYYTMCVAFAAQK